MTHYVAAHTPDSCAKPAKDAPSFQVLGFPRGIDKSMANVRANQLGHHQKLFGPWQHLATTRGGFAAPSRLRRAIGRVSVNNFTRGGHIYDQL
jgi:hypothetical protein